MKTKKVDVYKNDIKENFLKEKDFLKKKVISELKSNKNDVISLKGDMMKDILFVIDRGFEDILKDLNSFNIKEKEEKLANFKDSLEYVLYKI